MDPVSACGVAASVVQFINFTETLLRGTYEIYKSATPTGDTKINCDLMNVTTSLKTLNDELLSSLSQRISAGKSLSHHEIRIGRVCKECSEIADQLISKLKELRAQKRHNLWESFRKALQTVWNKRAIEVLELRLHSFRIYISFSIGASLFDQIDSLRTVQSDHGHLISSTLQVAQEVRHSLLAHMEQNTKWQQQVINAILSSKASRLPASWDHNALTLSPENQFSNEFMKRFRTYIFRELKFDDIYRRAQGISRPHPESFEWIYSSCSEDSTPNFVRFLEGDQNLFWITGKPASGKSTLMKLISDDHRTISHLKIWCSNEDLFVSRFYFWCSGTELQMSLEGLLRTLLYEAFEYLPHLIPIIFRDRMTHFILFGDERPLGDMAGLLEAFKLLVLEITKSKKMFLLIDGLDEFKGDHLEQLMLVKFLYSLLSLTPNIKMCVSSREWNVFADAFNARPSLRLEDLTYQDIQHYVSSRFSNNLGFVALQRGDPNYASSLIDNVSTKASGVFLWVVLVVRSLLQGLTDGDRLSDLQNRLASLPADLETLFLNILKSVDFGRASQLIQIVEKALELEDEGLTSIQLSFADEDEPEFIFDLQKPRDEAKQAKFSAIAEGMRRRINACSKGLLEMQTGYTRNPAEAQVEYLHRTVRDFVRRPEIWANLREATTHPFNPTVRLAISAIACSKTGYRNAKTSDRIGEVFWDLLMASMINIYRSHSPGMLPQSDLLDKLEKEAVEIMSSGVLGILIPYKRCPLTMASDELAVSSFLHLAVKLQLDTYVTQKAISFHYPDEIARLSYLFQIAAAEYRVTHSKFGYEHPSLRLIETFFKLGVSPNQRFHISRKTRNRTSVRQTKTIWQFVVSDSARRPEVLKLFLRYGADPFVPELDSLEFDELRKGGDDLRELLQAARQKVIENQGPRGEEPKKDASKTQSKWSRIRGEKLFGRRT